MPIHAQILHSLVSLKILRFKSEHANKILTIVTRDAAGRQLAEEAGIATLESLKKKPTTPEKPKTKTPSQITHRKFHIADLASLAKEKLQKLSRDEIPLANLRPISGVKNVWHKLSGGAEIQEVENGETLVVKIWN